MMCLFIIAVQYTIPFKRAEPLMMETSHGVLCLERVKIEDRICL